MNVLWLMADQMRADFTGFLGNGAVKTPHLDALAARGAVFSNAFAQSPICTPSRTSIFTGRYVHAHGAWWNGIGVSRPRPMLPQILQDVGFNTALIGKLHIYPQQDAHGFERIEKHEECLPAELSAYEAFLAAQNPPAALPFLQTEWTNRAAETGMCHMPEELEETRWVADRACAFLRESRERPFFLFASFIRPHSPYNPLPRFLEIYRDTPFAAPPFDRAEWAALPPRIAKIARTWGWDRLAPRDFAEIRRHYAALCSQVDEGVERILACLEEQGLAKDTIVVFMSDHGDFLGEHGMLYKEHLWDGALHVPLLIHDPRRPATRYDALTETIDVAPTLLESLGLSVPESFQGHNLIPPLNESGRPHKDAVFAEFTEHTVTPGVHDVLRVCEEPHMISVRTEEWKYIHYVNEDGELYNLRDDPEEKRNLYREAKYGGVIAELRRRILDWLITTRDRTPPEPANPYFSTYFGATETLKAHGN